MPWSASDVASAAADLDEMGFAPLLGEEGANTVSEPISIGGRFTIDDAETEPLAPFPTPQADSDEHDDTAELDGADIDLDDTSTPRPPVTKPHIPNTNGGEPSPSDKARKRSRKSQTRLVSYVVTGEGDTVDGSEQYAKNHAVDHKGIQLVMSFERSQGRIPKEMTHHHPGYDVESSDASGQVVRYIEVKSMADEWGARGVGITDEQFRRAHQLGESFWLYVVENVDGDKPKIYPINNPVHQIKRYLFDDGWRAVAEEPSEGTAPSRPRSILDLKPQTS